MHTMFSFLGYEPIHWVVWEGEGNETLSYPDYCLV
jgi:hypothetical protein